MDTTQNLTTSWLVRRNCSLQQSADLVCWQNALVTTLQDVLDDYLDELASTTERGKRLEPAARSELRLEAIPVVKHEEAS